MRILPSLGLLATAAILQAAPTLGEKSPRWEYAEMSFRTIPGRPGGVTPDGTEVPPTPSTMTIHWITGIEETGAKSWHELAEKLKVARFKKDGSASFQRIQILNHLGSEGWELMEQQAGPVTFSGVDPGRGGGTFSRSATGTILQLKRRVP